MRPTRSIFQLKAATRNKDFEKLSLLNKSKLGVSFDRNFPNARPSKVWDGKDRDEYFKKKFAHVHAKQVKPRERSIKEVATKPWSDGKSKNSHEIHRKKPIIPELISFNEYIYGTSSVLTALNSSKRTGMGILYISKPPHLADQDIVHAAKNRKIPIEYETSKQKLNQLTSNGVHNGYALRVRPLILPQVDHLLFNDMDNVGLNQNSLIQETKDELSTQENSTNYEYGIIEFKYEKPVLSPHHLIRPDIKDNAVGIYIDQVTDPHNIGAILRSAQFLGADFAVISSLNCAKLSPVVSKVSAGALESFPIYLCESPFKFFEKSAAQGWNIIAAVPPDVGVTTAKRIIPSELSTVNVESPSLLVVGSEGDGLRRSLLQRCTHVVSISNGSVPPKKSNNSVEISPFLDSLNVSVASALLLSRFFKD